MKDEIKEILDNPKILMLSYGNYISLDDYFKLKDYITNLQEENNSLKQMTKDTYDTSQEIMFELQERIDKAIEYINQNKHLSMFADCREPEEDWDYDLEINPRDLLNILQGVDKE